MTTQYVSLLISQLFVCKTPNVRFRKKSTTFTTWFDVGSKINPIWGKTANDGVYGWLSDDSIYSDNVRMAVDKNYRAMKGQTRFVIELELDCDNQKISYINQETKTEEK